MRFRDNYHIYAIITIFLWSSAFVFTRMALRYFSPLSLGFLRYAIASPVLLVFSFILKIKLPKKKDIKWFVLSGFFGFFFYMIVFNIGSSTVTAPTVGFILSIGPVITTLLARIIYKEKLSLTKYIAILIEFSGVGILTLINGVSSINIGFVWLIIASIAGSVYNILQRKLTKTYSAIQTSVFSIWFGTIMLSIFSPKAFQEIKTIPLIQIVYLLILGLFCSAVAYITWTVALSKTKKTASVTNYLFLTPFITILLAVVIANETPDFATIIGGVIIMIGMFIYYFSDKPKKNTMNIPGPVLP